MLGFWESGALASIFQPYLSPLDFTEAEEF